MSVSRWVLYCFDFSFVLRHLSSVDLLAIVDMMRSMIFFLQLRSYRKIWNWNRLGNTVPKSVPTRPRTRSRRYSRWTWYTCPCCWAGSGSSRCRCSHWTTSWCSLGILSVAFAETCSARSRPCCHTAPEVIWSRAICACACTSWPSDMVAYLWRHRARCSKQRSRAQYLRTEGL